METVSVIVIVILFVILFGSLLIGLYARLAPTNVVASWWMFGFFIMICLFIVQPSLPKIWQVLMTINLNAIKHTFGVIFSIMGLWLSGASIIGRKRLSRWDMNLRQFDPMGEEFPNSSIPIINNKFFQRIIKGIGTVIGEKGYGYWGILFVLSFLSLSIMSRRDMISDSGFILSIFLLLFISALTAFLLGLFLIATLVAFVFSLPVFLSIMMLPYRFISLLEKDASLERAILFIGILVGTAGILLLEF